MSEGSRARGDLLIGQRRPAYGSIRQLQADAIERMMLELAIAYGWSAMRLADEALQEQRRL